MKLAFFNTSLNFSGGRLAMFRHANELSRRGHDIAVWVEGPQARLDWMDLHVPIRTYSRAALPALPHADVCLFDKPRLAPLLTEARIGAVAHLCQGFEGTDTELRMQAIRAERTMWLQLPALWRLSQRLRRIEQAYRLPTAKLVTHTHLGELIARRFGQASHLVPYGLPEGLFRPSTAPANPTPTILVVGPADIGWKRIPDALRAVGLLKQRRPGVRLLRVAQHPMRDEERALGVTDEYHTMLKPAQMAELYRQADLLLISSDATEGFGLPVLEAMASGLPCVVTDIPAFQSFAQPANYAVFVPVADSEAMAGALETLLDAPHERRRLRQRGLEVAARYTMQRSQDAMEEALTRIASGSAHPAALSCQRPAA